MKLEIRNKAKRIGALLPALLALIPILGRAQVGVVNGLTQEKICAAGETFESYIRLKNNGPQEETVKIYQTDYLFNYDGKSYYDAPGKVGRSNAAWILPGAKQISLAGFAQTDVRFTCKVPANPVLNGTYWSIIMVEVVPPAPQGRKGASAKEINVGISQVMRYGVQVVTHIGDTGARKIKFVGSEFVVNEVQKTLQVDVENTGDRWLRPLSYVELYDDSGALAGKIEGERWRIYPGTSARFKFDLGKVPQGKYKALVVLDNQDSFVFGAQYAMAIDGVVKSAAPAVKKAPVPASKTGTAAAVKGAPAKAKSVSPAKASGAK
jgi:urease beta subunit